MLECLPRRKQRLFSPPIRQHAGAQARRFLFHPPTAACTTLCHATAIDGSPPTAGDRERRAPPLRFASPNLTSTTADFPRNPPPSKCLISRPPAPPPPNIPTFLGMLECLERCGRQIFGGSDERIEKAQNIPGPVGEGVSDFASFVTPEQQSGNDQPSQMLAARPDLNVKFVANLADAEFRVHRQQFENLNATVVGKSFDDPFQPFAAGPRSTNDAFSCLHPATSMRSLPPVDNIPTFLGMLECFRR